MTNSRENAEQALSLLKEALAASDTAASQTQTEPDRPSPADLAAALQTLQSELDEAGRQRDLWKQTSGQLQDVASNERTKAKRLEKQLKLVESGTDRVSRKEVNYWRKKAEDFEATRKDYQQRILELRNQLEQRAEQEAESEAARARDEELTRVQSLLEEREAHIAEISATIESNRLEREDFEQRIAQLDTEVRSLSQRVIDADNARNEACHAADNLDAELKDLRAEAAAYQQRIEGLQQEAERQTTLSEQYRSRIDELELQHEREIAALREEHARESETITQRLGSQLEALRNDYTQQNEQLITDRDADSNRIAELERQLTSERERSDNLNEIANEHREALAKTTEKLEEMVERYEDAKWHLGQARHFESLVKKRRKLIGRLIEKIRERYKANNALKAGLDSLRRYKANADERQQELLRRIEILEKSLSEAKEKLVQANKARRSTDAGAAGAAAGPPQATSPSMEQAVAEAGEPADLRKELLAQAEKIESLETKLKGARVAESEALARLGEVAKLQDDLATKSAFIATLQRDIEELEETLDELHEREFEVSSLRDLVGDREQQIKALQADNNRLRAAKSGEVDSLDQQKIAELEETIRKLTAKLKEYEGTITTLSEAADSWKRRYDFLAADTPYDFTSTSSTK